MSCVVLYIHGFYLDFQSFVNKLKIIRKYCIIGYPRVAMISIMVIIVSDKIHVKLDSHFWWKSQLKGIEETK